MVGQVRDFRARRDCRQFLGEDVCRQERLVRRRQPRATSARAPAAAEDVIGPEVVDLRPGETPEEVAGPCPDLRDAAGARRAEVVALFALPLALREPVGVLREEFALEQCGQVVPPELERQPALLRFGDDCRPVLVPAFEHPALAVGGDAVSRCRPCGAAAVEDARRRVMEEQAVHAVAAGELHPVAPFVVQPVVPEDERAPRERRRLAPDRIGQRPPGDEPGSARARPNPAVAEVFEQRIDAVQDAACVRTGDRDPVRGRRVLESIRFDAAGANFEYDADPGGDARAKVRAQFFGSVREDWVGGIELEGRRGDLVEGNGHTRILPERPLAGLRLHEVPYERPHEGLLRRRQVPELEMQDRLILGGARVDHVAKKAGGIAVREHANLDLAAARLRIDGHGRAPGGNVDDPARLAGVAEDGAHFDAEVQVEARIAAQVDGFRLRCEPECDRGILARDKGHVAKGACPWRSPDDGVRDGGVPFLRAIDDAHRKRAVLEGDEFALPLPGRVTPLDDHKGSAGLGDSAHDLVVGRFAGIA